MQVTMNESTHLTFQDVGELLSKSRWPIHRLVKAGRLEKVGRGRAARISLVSVLRYIEEEKQAAKAVVAVSATAGVNMAKARAMLQKKREEEKLRRALEKVGTENAAASLPVDPRLEACEYGGVVMSVAERDELIARDDYIRRLRAGRMFRSVRGV